MIQAEVATPQNVDHLRYWLEIAYFTSGPVLAVFAAFALRQITLTKRAVEVAKKDIETRTKRESVILASEKIEEFAKNVFPKMNECKRLIEGAGIELRAWNLIDFKFDESSLQADEKEGAKIWLEKLRASVDGYNGAVRLLNSLEAFSIYFANGAADEQIAYPPLSTAFCKYVRWLTPLLIALRAITDKDDLRKGRYRNTIVIYQKWMARIKKESLTDKSTLINSEMLLIDDSSLPLIGLEK